MSLPSDPRLAPIGRARRDATRAAKLKEDAERLIFSRLPWLRNAAKAPPDARDQIEALRLGDLRRLVETADEARLVGDTLHVAIDRWNETHRDDVLPAPPAMTALKAEADAWTDRRLARLRRWRPWGAAMRALLDAPPQPRPPRLWAGLALAAAIRHGGVGGLPQLGAFLDWMAEPDARLMRDAGLPCWIDLKVRARRRKRPPGGCAAPVLATATGEDADGPYALRRFQVDPDTLIALIGWFESAPDARDARALREAAGRPKAMAALLGTALDPDGRLGPPPVLRDLIDGALAEAELAPGGPDGAAVAVARGRQPSYSATPESWAASLGAPRTGAAACAAEDLEGAALAPEAEEETAPTAADARAARASAALNALMNSINPDVRPDLSTDAERQLAHDLRDRLRAARDNPLLRWTPAARLLLDWYVDQLDGIQARSVQRYHNSVALPLIAGASDMDLARARAEDLEELYAAIVENDVRSPRERRNLRNVLRRVHGFGVQTRDWSLSAVDPEVFGGDGATTRVRAVALSAAHVAAARALIRTHPDHPEDTRLAADAVLLLQWRTGLRIAEACKALLGNLEPGEGMLFVVPTRFGHNKTPWARRRVPVFALLSHAEAAELRVWLARRRQLAGAGPLFGVRRQDGRFAPFASTALGRLIGDALKAVTGIEEVSDHSLRRAAVGNLFRAIHAALAPVPQPAYDRDALDARLTGWTAAERARAAEAVAPLAIRRDAWRALARLAGHSDPGVTFEVYVHGWDLALFDRFARPVARKVYDGLVDRLGARVVSVERPAGEARPAAPPPIGEAPIEERPQRLVQALASMDDGVSVEAAAGAAFLPLEVLRAAVETADALRLLRTKRREARLQPATRLHCLAPQPVRADAEEADAARIVATLWAQRDALGPRLAQWIAPVLLTATQTNSGVSFASAHDLARWLRIGLTVAPAARWRVDLLTPTRTAWDEDAWLAAAGGVATATTPRPKAASATARLRLTHPALAGGESRLGDISDAYASGSLRQAAHALAIALGLGPRALALA